MGSESFTVDLHPTATLNNKSYGSTAMDRTKTYIEGAFNQSEHSVTVNIEAEVAAPQEDVYSSFQAYAPCDVDGDGFFEKYSYSNLGEWWLEYVDTCNNLTSVDSNILLTDEYGESGIAYNNLAVAVEGGPKVEDLPSSYNKWGDAYYFNAMQTILHELAHCLLDGTYNGDSYSDHRVGVSLQHDNEIYHTPMAGNDYNENECTETVNDRTSHDHWTMQYSECCETRMGE